MDWYRLNKINFNLNFDSSVFIMPRTSLIIRIRPERQSVINREKYSFVHTKGRPKKMTRIRTKIPQFRRCPACLPACLLACLPAPAVQDIASPPFSAEAETLLRPAPLRPHPSQLRIILRRSPGARLVATGPTTPCRFPPAPAVRRGAAAGGGGGSSGEWRRAESSREQSREGEG